MIFGINTTCNISITYNNFEISLVVFMPNITTNHAITYTNLNCLRVLGVTLETPKSHVNDIRENSCLDLNKFISDELQPDENFRRQLKGAIKFLYQELESDLEDTDYKIHNLIKVSGVFPSPKTFSRQRLD